VPTILADLIKDIQTLWNNLDLKGFRYYIERLIYKIEDIIKGKGIATSN
jgi:hypothetical protein